MNPIDRLQRFPNQDIQNRPTACTAETVSDIWGNVQNQPYTPDFTFAATQRLMNVTPNTSGADPYSAMLSAVVYGCLPTDDDPTTVANGGEILAANYANYTPQDIHLASLFPANGVTSLPLYEDICNYLDQEKQGVSLAMTWYQSFMAPNADGTLPAPSGATTSHNVAVYGYTAQGLLVKPWLGQEWGAGGYCYLPEAYFSQVSVESYGFNLSGWRWFSLASIAVTHPSIISDILPQL